MQRIAVFMFATNTRNPNTFKQKNPKNTGVTNKKHNNETLFCISPEELIITHE